MATKKLKLQIFDNLKELLWAVLVLGISVYGGIQVFLNGSGNRTKPENSLKGLMKRFLYWLEDTGHGDIVVGVLLAIFGMTALICICLIIYHLARLTPKRSVLGRSILTQASGYEAFEELVKTIDEDLAMESHKFGTELVAGSQWILSEQAMRIRKIERAYIGKKKVEKKKKDILLVADGEGNTMEIAFYWDQNRDEAVQYLREKIPELYIGNLTELE